MYKINYISHNWLVHFKHNREFRRKAKYIRGRVVDLGCGTSPYKKDVLEIGGDYVGVDWANSIHDIVPDVVADLSKPFPLEDQYADTLLSFQWRVHEAPHDYFRYTKYGLEYLLKEAGGYVTIAIK